VKRFLRRIRGVIGAGILWSMGWGVVFLGFRLLFGPPQAELSSVVAVGMFFGFFGGASFALILSVVERRRNLDQLSLWRVALWGFLGATALLLCLRLFGLGSAISFGPSITTLGFQGLLGAGFATGSVAIARQETPELTEGDGRSMARME